MHTTSLAISALSLGLYVYCWWHSWVHPDGRGRQYLLIVFGSLAVYYLCRTVGYAGLQSDLLTPENVNDLFRYAGYSLVIPGLWISIWGWSR